MAKNDYFLIANPTKAAITVNSVTINPGQVKKVENEDESGATHIIEWLTKGCSVAPAKKVNATSEVASTTPDSLIQIVEKGGFLLQNQTRAVVSAAGEEWAEKGI